MSGAAIVISRAWVGAVAGMVIGSLIVGGIGVMTVVWADTRRATEINSEQTSRISTLEGLAVDMRLSQARIEQKLGVNK